MRRTSLLVCLACTAAALSVAPLAQAAFPGQNGRIAFQRAGVESSIWTIQPDGSGATALTDDTSFDGGPVWSPDGSRIAFWSTRTGNGEIFVMNADGSGLVNITNTPGGEVDPAWSPDGTKIAFLNDDAFDLYVMNADGSGVTQLTSGPGLEAAASWSPDGTRIAYSDEPDYPIGDSRIATVNPDGTGMALLTTGEQDSHPDWSPDGTRIVFSRDPELFANVADIWVMNSDGTGQTQVTSGETNDSRPAWSPDGTRIAFDRSPGNNADIYTMNPDGTGLALVTGDPVSETHADWQPIVANRPPDCSAVRATPASLGAPNHRLVTVTISGATDPDGDTVDLAITGVTQDEPLHRPADAVATTQPHRVRLRADRDPHGDGRVYRIAFQASDGRGGTCTGFATASVRKGTQAVDSAPPSYDSFGS